MTPKLSLAVQTSTSCACYAYQHGASPLEGFLLSMHQLLQLSSGQCIQVGAHQRCLHYLILKPGLQIGQVLLIAPQLSLQASTVRFALGRLQDRTPIIEMQLDLTRQRLQARRETRFKQMPSL